MHIKANAEEDMKATDSRVAGRWGGGAVREAGALLILFKGLQRLYC
jgi:hypothetical protein